MRKRKWIHVSIRDNHLRGLFIPFYRFHQKVPTDCPSLELKATHGLVSPEEFTNPPLHELWTPEAYASFDLTKGMAPGDKVSFFNKVSLFLFPVVSLFIHRNHQNPKLHHRLKHLLRKIQETTKQSKKSAKRHSTRAMLMNKRMKVDVLYNNDET